MIITQPGCSKPTYVIGFYLECEKNLSLRKKLDIFPTKYYYINLKSLTAGSVIGADVSYIHTLALEVLQEPPELLVWTVRFVVPPTALVYHAVQTDEETEQT